MGFKFDAYNNLRKQVQKISAMANFTDVFLDAMRIDELGESKPDHKFYEQTKTNPLCCFFEELTECWNRLMDEVYQNLINNDGKRLDKYLMYIYYSFHHLHIDLGSTMHITMIREEEKIP
jgi:hypothetical protein